MELLGIYHYWVFAILLMTPVSLWLLNRANANGDNTVRHGFPAPEAAVWRDKGYYQAVEGWFQESLPIGRTLQRFNRWLAATEGFKQLRRFTRAALREDFLQEALAGGFIENAFFFKARI